MDIASFDIVERKVVIKIRARICETPEEVLRSRLFRTILELAVKRLAARGSMLMGVFERSPVEPRDLDTLVETLSYLVNMPADLVPNVVPGSRPFLRDRALFNDFVEDLYNFWRSFDRFIICDSTGDALDKRPYRTFNATIEQLTHLIRGMYRDIEENITARHPSIYRQVSAGAEVAAISLPYDMPFASPVYRKLDGVPVLRQVLLLPPMILDPPVNKRTGRFVRVNTNPLDVIPVDAADWLCYPARVGELIVLVYCHKTFYDLMFALLNLFDLADEADLRRKPDAVFLFGAPTDAVDKLGPFPTVFHEDATEDILVAACPNRPEFGYFGYLKKMILTLHNVAMMKRGRMPFHGAFVKIMLRGGARANILIIGDTGAGKSETLEAFRELGGSEIQDMIVIADDMGSLDIAPDGRVLGYGTEIGAFLRLDDLKPGYAFGQIDRAIIMSPSRTNARIVLPVTTHANVIAGTEVDYVLYANNYEEIDDDHPVIERFDTPERAVAVFREGTVMSKGTTTTTGIVHSYFANVFGPPEYRDLHEKLADRFFRAFFDAGVYVGQMRTRLGIPGSEQTGPGETARSLIDMLHVKK